ncbi:MAG: type II secretion system protein GspJ, partial [Gammaproteobacteria bacterium]
MTEHTQQTHKLFTINRWAIESLQDSQLPVASGNRSRLCSNSCFPAVETRNCGFTLIEVLIAIAIFAVLSLLAYGGLQSVITGKQQTEEALLRLRELQLTMNHFQRDFEQLVPRDARDELGGKLHRLSAGLDSDLLVQFTRG